MDILNTTIKTSEKTKKRLLKHKKRRTECFDDIINNLIDLKEKKKIKIKE